VGGGIIDREERKYPEMPERDEQEYVRMLPEDPGRTRRRLVPAGPRVPTMSSRFGLLLVCCGLLTACSAGSAASSSPPSGVALAGTFTDDSFQARDYAGNACAIFESGAWQLQVKAGGSTTVAVVAFTNAAVADAPGSGPGDPVYGLCRGTWSVSVPKSADYVITAISSGDDGDSQLPGSVVVPGSYGRLGIQLGDDYGEELTG
jgi:hypothetical protein